MTSSTNQYQNTEDIAAQQHEEEIQARFDSFPDYI